MKLLGREDSQTLTAANNFADSLLSLHRFEEAKSLLRKTIPVARRVLGEGDRLSLMMRWTCARAVWSDPGATLDDIREALTTLEETERTTRRVLGGAHPLTVDIEDDLQKMQAALHASETGDMSDVNAICEGLEAMTRGDAK